MRGAIAALSLLAGCHSLLGIEDTTVDDGTGPVEQIGLDRIVVAQVIAPQLALPGVVPPGDVPRGALIDIEFVAEPVGARLVLDERDAEGYGCVVLTRGAQEPSLVENQGSVDITGAAVAVPPCRFTDGRYLCADLRTSTPDPVTITNEPDGRAPASVLGAAPAFSEPDRGRHLVLPGERPLPIREIAADDAVVLFDPFATTRDVAAAEHAVALGLGPAPIPIDLLTGGETVAASKGNGDGVGPFALQTAAPGADFALDAGSDRPEAAPLAGPVRFSCSGVDGNCGAGATHTAVWARATDVRAEPLALSTHLASAAETERELHCMFAAEDVEISEAAMAALVADAGTRRFAMAVMRGTVAISADEQRPVALFAGFGRYGVVSISEADDVCDAQFQDCSPGLRCTAVTETAGAEGVNRCVADGSAERGQLCESRDGQVVGSTDDCVAGTGCTFEVCRDICNPDEVRCGAAQLCTRFVNLVYGMCVLRCDPLDQSTCSGEDGCYHLFGEGGVCVAPVDMPKALGEQCDFINDCEPGALCGATPDGSMAICQSLCDTSGCSDAQGVPDACGCSTCGPDETCLSLNDDANPDLGRCVVAAELCDPDTGDCCDCAAMPICPAF